MEKRTCNTCRKERTEKDFYQHKGSTYYQCKYCFTERRKINEDLKKVGKKRCINCFYVGPVDHFPSRKCYQCQKVTKYKPVNNELEFNHPWVRDEYLYTYINIDGNKINLNHITREEVSLLIRNGYLFIFKDKWWENSGEGKNINI